MIDLRDHLEALKERNELVTIADEMDADLDIAAVAAMGCRAGTQAIHFTKPLGYAAGYTVAANLLTGPFAHYPRPKKMWNKIATALGLDPGIEYEALIPTVIERYQHPILPIKLVSAPCKEVVHTDADIDLLNLPFPLIHKEDGGRYGTGVLITKDPESDWQNWGVYRFMITGHNEIVADFLSEPSFSTDTKTIYNRYAAVNRPMPFAIALGGAPAIMLAAALRAPAGMSEVEVAGGLNLDPINLVQAETSELLVAGDAEVVIEGEVVPGEMVEEGPYGSIKGYTRPQPRPKMKVTALTHRKDPIIPLIVDGTKVCDTQAIVSIMESARVTMRATLEHQMPLRWFQIPPDYDLTWGIGSVMNLVNGVVFRFARYIFAVTNLFDKLLVVEHELMPGSLTRIWNDYAQKCHPVRGHRILENYRPAVMPNYGEIEPGKGTPRMYFDACWPAYWKPEERPLQSQPEALFPKEVIDKVIEKWKKVNIPLEPVIAPPGQRM